MKYDVAVIGGGASGLACAVRLTEKSKLKTVIIEAGERLGKKLSATGNGQGNISNTDLSPDHYFGGGANLAGRFACNNPQIYAELFDCIFTADAQGRIYPAGRQASSLTDCLIRKLNGKADIMLSTKVIGIEKGFTLNLSDGNKITAGSVVLCVGGKAQKQFKTDGSSYALACAFGHKLTPLYPSLVQLKTITQHIKTLKGIRADCTVSAVKGAKILKSVRGDVIFTEYGVSGNAVFALSPYVAGRDGITLSLEFLPDVTVGEIVDNLKKRRMAGYAQEDLLSGTLHNRIGRAVIARAADKTDMQIAHMLKNFTLPVTGTLGFDYAQVTRGGIDMGGITDRLESKLVKNLYFAGEVLDVDGDCGGYNLHWAFASGLRVADAILEDI